MIVVLLSPFMNCLEDGKLLTKIRRERNLGRKEGRLFLLPASYPVENFPLSLEGNCPPWPFTIERGVYVTESSMQQKINPSAYSCLAAACHLNPHHLPESLVASMYHLWSIHVHWHGPGTKSLNPLSSLGYSS